MKYIYTFLKKNIAKKCGNLCIRRSSGTQTLYRCFEKSGEIPNYLVNKRYLTKDHICWKTLLLVNKPKDGLSASWGRGKKTVKDLEQEKRCTTERYTGAALLERLRRVYKRSTTVRQRLKRGAR